MSAGAAAAGAARLAYSAMNRRPPGGPKVWSRTNHRGEPVTLLEGPAVAAGAIAGVLAQRLTGSPGERARCELPRSPSAGRARRRSGPMTTWPGRETGAGSAVTSARCGTAR